jgi:Fe-S-cluster containining protein
MCCLALGKTTIRVYCQILEREPAACSAERI